MQSDKFDERDLRKAAEPHAQKRAKPHGSTLHHASDYGQYLELPNSKRPIFTDTRRRRKRIVVIILALLLSAALIILGISLLLK